MDTDANEIIGLSTHRHLAMSMPTPDIVDPVCGRYTVINSLRTHWHLI